VANHLILSTAAFRQNPQAQTTWKRLFERGVEGRRLTLLALFTAIDIRSTNPEAWTDWKAKLMLSLVENLRSPQARSLHAHLQHAQKAKSLQPKLEAWLLELDPILLESLSPKLLVTDLLAAHKTEQPVKVVTGRDKRLWVRFHRRRDEPGVFLSFVQQLFGFALSIQMSSVNTLDEIGVYDWFCLRTEKPARQIAKWMALPPPTQPPKLPKVEFQSIDLMSQDESEWIFSFRGRDQRGLLLSAAQALHDETLSIRWARAHTWGQQVDDIFAVQPLGEVENVLLALRKRFVT
jgi:[protein-PII] uridylyltransferase